jgi:hypothetical protein
MTLNVSNGTTLEVTLVVNGIEVDRLAAQDGAFDIPADALPALPWSVEVRSPSGRLLVSMGVLAGDVWTAPVANGGTEWHGAANRVDLSCGRIDIWSGPPIYGPVPGAGAPGDCAP